MNCLECNNTSKESEEAEGATWKEKFKATFYLPKKKLWFGSNELVLSLDKNTFFCTEESEEIQFLTGEATLNVYSETMVTHGLYLFFSGEESFRAIDSQSLSMLSVMVFLLSSLSLSLLRSSFFLALSLSSSSSSSFIPQFLFLPKASLSLSLTSQRSLSLSLSLPFSSLFHVSFPAGTIGMQSFCLRASHSSRRRDISPGGHYSNSHK